MVPYFCFLNQHTLFMKHLQYLTLLFASLFIGCHSHESGHDHELEEEAHEHSSEITISPDKAQALGITSKAMQPGAFQGAIACTGNIRPAWHSQAALIAPSSGVIRLMGALSPGTVVGKGQALATISSDGIQGGDQVESARIRLEKAKSEFERSQRLYQEQLLTASAMNQAREAYLQAENEVKALGSSQGGGVVLKSSMSGYMVRLDVSEGDYVEAGQSIGQVANSARVLLSVQLPGRHFQKAGQIQSANIRAGQSERYLSSEDLNGKVISTAATLTDGMLPVSMEMDCTDELPIGSFCQVYLLTRVRQGVLSLPMEALTEEQGVMYCYKQLDEDCYEKVPVLTGETNGKSVEILSGISEGDLIVHTGAIHVRLASASNAIPAHSHHH